MMSDTDRILAVMPDLLGALETAEAFIKAVIEGYATDVSHHDYRVQVAVWAEDALPEVSAAIKKAKGQSDVRH